jgi:uncharacterized protein (TIGR03086 family)
MTDDAGARYRRAADGFTARVEAVPADGWERPAPPEGWVARDVVRHLVEWVPGFFDDAGGPPLAVDTPVDDDPARAWRELDAHLRAALADDAIATSTISHPYAGTHRFDEAVAMFVSGDVLVHTWDLARAVGLDEHLDPGLVHDLLVGMEPIDEMLRVGGQYGPRVEVPADADEQTRLIAFTGRTP